MNCEKCRWYRTIYNTKGIGNWYVYGTCLMGGCDGSQYEPKENISITKYIDADKMLKEYEHGIYDTTDLAEMLYYMPAADVQEVRHGRWIYLGGLDAFECSVCGRQMVRNIFDYCPWCGAKMDEVTK